MAIGGGIPGEPSLTTKVVRKSPMEKRYIHREKVTQSSRTNGAREKLRRLKRREKDGQGRRRNL